MNKAGAPLLAGASFVQPLPAAELRGRAERFVARGAIAPGRTPDELRRQLHELQVSQIELEMQNVALAELQTQKEYVERGLHNFVDLYQNAPSCYLSLARDGSIVRANLAAERLLGAPRSSLVGRIFERYVGAADQGAFRRFLDAVFGGTTVAALEMPLDLPGQPARLLRITANVDPAGQLCRMVLGEQGGPVGSAALLRETAFRLGAVKAYVLVVDNKDTVVYVNQAFCDATGYHGDEVLGRDANFINGGAYPPAASEHIRATLRRRGYWHGGVPCQRKDGSFFMGDFAVIAMRGDDGALDHVICMFVNGDDTLLPATAALGAGPGAGTLAALELAHARCVQQREAARRVDAERVVSASEQLHRATLDALAERILLLDADGVVLFANQACRLAAGRAGAGLDYVAECRVDARFQEGAGAVLAAGIVAVAGGQVPVSTLDYVWQAGSTTLTRHRYRVRVSALPAPLGVPLQLVVAHTELQAPAAIALRRGRRQSLPATPAGAGHAVLSQRRPGMLDLGLQPALAWLVQDFQRRAGLACRLRVTDAELCRRIGAATEEALYHIVDEALRNVQRHAAARQVDVALGSDAGTLLLVVHDDGVGITAGQRQHGGGQGLAGIAARGAAVGGALKLGRYSKDGGTRLALRIPLALIGELPAAR